eukprot:XP_011682613.1 PREDICTED: multiple epidermal growth factor-like domains protein 11 [Strongylocentrotus purpuratus]
MDSLLGLVTCCLIITRSVALVVTSGGPVTTFAGGQSEMTCTFSPTNSQGLSFAWSFDGQNGHSDQIGICDVTQCTSANPALHQLVISADNGVGRMKLNVSDTVSSDAGDYTCLVSTSEDAQSALVKLKVTACRYGQIGSDCLQYCHCKDGMPCNVFTGRCKEGCESGWSGEGCQVSSVCPVGYFGVDCTDHCNCPDNVGCNKVSGFCSTTEGQCEVGFTSDSVDMPDSCNSLTECYNLCSRRDDCNSAIGSCSSGRCHLQWTGESCPIATLARVPSGSIATAVGSAVGAFLVIFIVISSIFIFYKQRSDESATTESTKGKESDSSPQHENSVFDQSKTDVNTYQELNTNLTDPHAYQALKKLGQEANYQDLNTDSQRYSNLTDPHAYQSLKKPDQEANYQDLNTDSQRYANLTDHHTYQALKKPEQEANYEELNGALKRDYVNVPGIQTVLSQLE